MRSRTAHRVTAALLLALAAVAACSDDQPTADPSRSTTTPPSASSSIDPQATVKARVLAAYRGFSAAASRAEAHPNRAPSGLRQYSIDKALANVLATVALYRQQGIVVRGKADHDPSVIALRTTSQPPTATIRDCVDLTDVDAVYRSTGKSAIAPDQSRRHITIAEATVARGRWVIRDVSAHRNRPC